MTRQDILDFLMAASGSGQPFWGAAAATVQDVAQAARLGASWVTITHGCMFTPQAPASVMALLPFVSSNEELLSKGDVAQSATLPALAGVFASDQFNRPDHLLKSVWNAGFRGVQNFPSTGLAEGRFAGFVRETGMDYDREIEMAAKAHAMDFFVSALVFSPGQAVSMADAGADMLVFHPGLNADGEFRGRTRTTLERFAAIAETARRRSKDILLARLAFEREDSAGGAPHGVQYDRSVR